MALVRGRRNGNGQAVILSGPYEGRIVREIRCIETDRLNESEIAELFRR